MVAWAYLCASEVGLFAFYFLMPSHNKPSNKRIYRKSRVALTMEKKAFISAGYRRLCSRSKHHYVGPRILAYLVIKISCQWFIVTARNLDQICRRVVIHLQHNSTRIRLRHKFTTSG